MIILLPPSEGKYQPARGNQVDLSALSCPDLLPQRKAVMSGLVELCRSDPQAAAVALDLGPSQFELVELNSRLPTAPSAAAGLVYTGVLYSALDYPGLSGVQLRRANRRLRFVSALFGLIQPSDRIPAYRLSGGAKLPGLGPLPALWRDQISACVASEPGLVVDMLSSPYSSMVKLPPGSITVKVWQEGPSGQRTAVSHFNKATKGNLARFLATRPEQPRTGAEVVELLASGSWEVELSGSRLDVMMRS